MLSLLADDRGRFQAAAQHPAEREADGSWDL
jgi:hypothetical protein